MTGSQQAPGGCRRLDGRRGDTCPPQELPLPTTSATTSAWRVLKLFDRTAEHRAKLRGEAFESRRHATEETVELSQLPCWRHLSPEIYRDMVARLIKEIEADAAAERKRTGRKPLGAAAILRQHPHTCPNKSKKSPAPRFHAASKAAREALRQVYGFFLAAFREAAERLKGGDHAARFPNGCFPPGLPFVRA
jgi:hypothetical protein